MSINIPVGEITLVPNGEHTGIIQSVDLREVTLKNGKSAEYLDFVISLDDIKKSDGDPMELRYSCAKPAALNVQNKLGRTLKAMGFNLKVGANLDIENLVGLKCRFMTKNMPNKDHTAEFAEILDVIEKA